VKYSRQTDFQTFEIDQSKNNGASNADRHFTMKNIAVECSLAHAFVKLMKGQRVRCGKSEKDVHARRG